jgi:peptide/nickel transport system permease protein
MMHGETHHSEDPGVQSTVKGRAEKTAAEERAPFLSRHRWLKRLLHDKGAVLGGAAMLLLVFLAIAAPLLTPMDPMRMDPLNRLQRPSSVHPFGTDSSGRDVFSMVIYGARISLVVGLLVMAVSSLAGVVMGLLSGYFRTLDNLIMRISDGMMAFPSILLAVAMMAVLGPRVSNIIIALGIVYTPRMARIIRSVTLSCRAITYVEAATALGATDLVIAFRHILPNCVPPMIVQGTFVFAFSVLAESSLSFLGVGAPPYIPSWGNVISMGRLLMIEAPWISLFPGFAILFTVLALNFLGDGLRDSLDPRMQKVNQ